MSVAEDAIAEEPAPEGPTTDTLIRARDRGRVLIVDDEPGIRQVCETFLEFSGFDVVTAGTASEALRAIEEAPFDAIVSDIQMPEMDGLQLLETLRDRGLDAPVILITGAPSLETAKRAVEFGALCYLEKPCEMDELEANVAQAVRRARIQRVQQEAMSLLKRSHAEEEGQRSEHERFDRALESVWLARQPIVRWSIGEAVAWEGLLRCDESSLPGAGPLLELAECLGRSGDLARVVRRQAADAARQLPGESWLHTNVSPADLADDDLYDPASPLARVASSVVIEITEGERLEGVQGLAERTAALRDLGFRIAVDDLGAGYAGLNSFAAVRPDIVKLDMGLVRDIDRDPTRARVASSMIELCRDMDILLVAEGIETIAERDTLVELGCDYFQGYLFGRPSPVFATDGMGWSR